MTAKLLCDLPKKLTGLSAKVYQMDPPYLGNKFIRVSRVDHKFAQETFIFACDKRGNVSSWIELEGSVNKPLSHEEVLKGIGYVCTVCSGRG